MVYRCFLSSSFVLLELTHLKDMEYALFTVLGIALNARVGRDFLP